MLKCNIHKLILALQSKLPTLTPGPRYTHLALWWKMKLWERLKVHKTSEIVRKNAYGIVSRARWVYLSTSLQKLSRAFNHIYCEYAYLLDSNAQV